MTKRHFLLAHSAKITTTTLQEKLGYLSDTEFANELMDGAVNIPDGVDGTTALVFEEIMYALEDRRCGAGERAKGYLLMEGDCNYFNKWAFGHEAINAL